jgi:hypothetical protein
MNGELPGLFTRVRGISILRTSCILQSWSRTKKESMDEKDEARDLTVNMGAVKLHLSPDVFHRYAGHYYKCKQDFVCPDDGSSPVPYFLLCRAIELQIKARHLKRLTQKEVKNRFRHHLLKAYKALDAQEQILSQSEVEVLTAADQIYGDKEFEYFRQEDALTGSSRIPDLDMLDTIAKKLIYSGSTTSE